MTSTVVIIGCGGFGREVWSIVQALRAAGEFWEVEGFVDDSPSDENRERVRALGSDLLGSVADLAARRTPYSAVIAVGSPGARRNIHVTLAASPVTYPRLIHPDSTIGSLVDLGEGTVVAAGARLSTNISVGAQVHIDQNVTVGHDTTIGAFARLNPQACVSGSVAVAEGALVGAAATILPELTVGRGATVGAAACVTRNVTPSTIVKGVPAR